MNLDKLKSHAKWLQEDHYNANPILADELECAIAIVEAVMSKDPNPELLNIIATKNRDQELTLERIADSIISDSVGTIKWYYPDYWENLDAKTQDTVMDLVYPHADYCTGCGWVCFTDELTDTNFGELVCGQCCEEED